MGLQDKARTGLALLAVLAGLGDALPLHAAPEAADPAWRAALCGQRTPCRLTRALEGGTNEAGQRLVVVQLLLHEEGGAKGPGGTCQAVEYWVLALAGTSIADRQLLLASCNEGGAEEDVTVGAGRFTWQLHGGGPAWKGLRERVLRLAPPQLLAEASEQSWIPGLSGTLSRWSWETFSGNVAWYSPWCNAPADQPGPAAPADLTYRYLLIPQVKAPPDLAAGGWTTTSLGSCALLVDSTGRQGFLVQGEPGTAEDAWMKVVLVSEQDLLVEIHDDQWISGAHSWPAEDHLDLWLGPRPAHDRCVNPLLQAKQWSIRMSDGKVFPGFGTLPKERLQVERQEVVVRGGRTVMRVHAVLPRPLGALTVAYADADDGKTTERTIATSLLVPGQLPTLGAAQVVLPRKAVCEVHRDVLNVKQLPYRELETP